MTVAEISGKRDTGPRSHESVSSSPYPGIRFVLLTNYKCGIFK